MKKNQLETTKEYSKLNAKIPKLKKKEIDPNLLIPTGSTILNLTCSDRIEGAFQLGKFTNVIGDSEAGKSFLMWTMLAECANDPRFDEYDLIYDDCEAAGEFDIPTLFGKKTADRVIDDPDNAPEVIEQFMDKIAGLLEKGKPFIYVLDSLDSISSEDEMDKAEKNRKKREKGNQTTGSYGDGKPKKLSEFFRINRKKLKVSKSAVIIISQTRDNIGFGAMFNPKTRSGGKALKFYSTHEVWISMMKQEKKGGRRVATDVMAKITKNKLTGRKGEAYFTNIQDYGIDDISSCINFMIDEGKWTGGKGINVKGFAGINESITMKKLIEKIEEEGLLPELRNTVQQTYNDILESLKPDRKKKYD